MESTHIALISCNCLVKIKELIKLQLWVTCALGLLIIAYVAITNHGYDNSCQVFYAINNVESFFSLDASCWELCDHIHL
jgi:hypothetical protein